MGARSPGRKERISRCAGQATVELALILGTMLIPLTGGLLAIAELTWTYHALVTLTRQGAHYAATHCFQDANGSDVVTWMQNNAPPFLDRPQLTGGTIQLSVNYWTVDMVNGVSTPFDGSSCAGANSPSCVPDAVTVGISGYQFRHLLPLIGLQPVEVPSFSTTVEIESGGGDPDTGTCNPVTGS